MNDGPRVVPPRDELKQRREQEQRRSAREWLQVARDHIRKAKGTK